MGTDYTLRLATSEDASEIWSVMDTCYQALEHKEYFICDDLEYVKDILSGHGFGVVACDDYGKIVGNLLVKYPGTDAENLGYDVFRDEDKHHLYKKLNRVLHMDSASVLPKHRGHKLEHQMITFAETLVDTSRYCYSFATVAPENTASLKSLEKTGYRIMVTKEKYSGLIRCVMMKELNEHQKSNLTE
ncbi:MAG: hypothetical protein IKL49_07030 [Lachnospiraceae bacterium]|nr:hypothetical protein [Lachnospiraceae bacterium]